MVDRSRNKSSSLRHSADKPIADATNILERATLQMRLRGPEIPADSTQTLKSARIRRLRAARENSAHRKAA